MTYYHISILWGKVYHYEKDRDEGAVRGISENYNGGKKFLFDGRWISPIDIEAIHIFATESPSEKLLASVFSLHKREVTRNWIYKSPQMVPDDKSKQPQEAPRKSVFIVHGRDHKPMKELKTMILEFGLNPIVLHEQPGGSRTIVEKLEKYSDVGYTFVILTPDDRGGTYKGKVPVLGALELENTGFRARQNVILEFGYFIGKLGRERVCCLHKGNVELPSDMYGIVYIPFEESVEEIRLKVMKELKEAGYEIKI